MPRAKLRFDVVLEPSPSPNGAVMELKARTDDGGARVYFFRVAENAFALGRFECKKEDAANQNLLYWTAQVAMFYAKGQTEVIV
jgi:hypothetical protein